MYFKFVLQWGALLSEVFLIIILAGTLRFAHHDLEIVLAAEQRICLQATLSCTEFPVMYKNK